MDPMMDPMLTSGPGPVSPIKIAAAAANAMQLEVNKVEPAPMAPMTPNPQAPPAQQGVTRQKRHQIAVACARCRSRKSKCDGARPTCASCKNRGCDCHYDVEADATRAIAQKRRQEAMQRKLDQYQEIYQYLRERPPEEANGILQRIRDGWDVLELHSYIKEGELLLQVPPPNMPGIPGLPGMRNASTSSVDGDRASPHLEPEAPS